MKKVDVDRKKAISNLFIDIAKLTFASFILGGILRGELPQSIIIIAGFALTTLGIIFGLFLTAKNIEEKEK